MLIMGFVLLIPSVSIHSQKIIFLHHSTGSGVYNEGQVAAWISDYNTAHATNYFISEQSYPNTPYPWENYPYDYWNLWINNACSNSDPDIECLNSLCISYNVIIFKHCFPGAGILPDDLISSISSSKKTMGNYQLQYRALRDLMDTYPDNKFIVWTLAPLHRLDTDAESAARARLFVDWVKNEWLTEDGKEHPNIYIFDFFGYAAESNSTPENGQVNCLKYDYERSHTENDSHPNLLANETIAPIFSEFIVNTIEDIQNIRVTSITVTGADGANSITTSGGTLQVSAAVVPDKATNKTMTWSIQNGTGQATISADGLVTAIADGIVTATATATDGSVVSGSLDITITGQTVMITSITVTGAGGLTTITTPGGTLQLSAEIMPANTINNTVTWSIENGTGEASISSDGLVTAISNGTVTAMATATDSSGVSGSLTITITGQTILVTSIILTGAGGLTTITAPGGTLQLSAEITPVNATNKAVTWSIENGTGEASISSDGLVTAISKGTVTVLATAADGSGITGDLEITIEMETVMVTAIVVYGEGFATTIPSPGSTLQMHPSIIPENATDKTVTWSVENSTGQATISTDGLLTAVSPGLVTVIATALDGSGVTGILDVVIGDEVSPTGFDQLDIKPFLLKMNESEIYIEFRQTNTYKQIRLYNLHGEMLISEQVTSNSCSLNINRLPAGIYVLKASGDHGIAETAKVCNW